MTRKEIENFFDTIINREEFSSDEEYKESLEIFIRAFEITNKKLSEIQHTISPHNQSPDFEKIKKVLNGSDITDIAVFQKNNVYFLDITALKDDIDEGIKLAIEVTLQLNSGTIKGLGDELSLVIFSILLEKEEVIPCSLIASYMVNIKNRILTFDCLRKKCAEIEDYDRASIYRDKVIFLKKYQHNY